MSRDARKGLNEAWFRNVNERLEQRAARLDLDSSSFEIVCECDEEECTERIPVSYREYESARVSATTFIVAPGHADPSAETVVDGNDRYELVQKQGEAAAIAVAENPRA
jgi:hypothetical protein